MLKNDFIGFTFVSLTLLVWAFRWVSKYVYCWHQLSDWLTSNVTTLFFYNSMKNKTKIDPIVWFPYTVCRFILYLKCCRQRWQVWNINRRPNNFPTTFQWKMNRQTMSGNGHCHALVVVFCCWRPDGNERYFLFFKFAWLSSSNWRENISVKMIVVVLFSRHTHLYSAGVRTKTIVFFFFFF